MSLELPFGIKPVNPVAVDYYSGPWSGASTQEAVNAANSGIPAAVRFTGLTANLVISGEAKKYWYASGITDSHLVNFGETLDLATTGNPSGIAFFGDDGLITTDTPFYYGGYGDLHIESIFSSSGIKIFSSGDIADTHSEYFKIDASTTRFNIGTFGDGDGDGPDLYIYRDGASHLELNSAGTQVIRPLIPNVDGSPNIGRSDLRFGTVYSWNLDAESHSATGTPLKVKGAAAQSANLTEWQDSAGNVLAHVDSGGNIATSGDIAVGFGGNNPEGSVLFPLTDGTFSRIHATSQGIRIQGYTGVTNMTFDRYFNYVHKSMHVAYGSHPSIGYPNRPFGDAYIQRLKLQKSQWANADRLAENMMEVQNASGYLSMIIDSSGDMHLSSGNALYANNYYGDENNYERLEVKWDANEAVLTTTAAGSGTPRGMKLQNTGGNFTIDAASSASIKAVGAVSITAYNAIYQQFTITGVGYRKDCYPIFDSSLNLGTTALRWGTTYTNTIDVDASGATSVPAVIKGAAAQSANLTEWQDSAGEILSEIDSDGHLSIYNSGSTSTNYERAFLGWGEDYFKIRTSGVGTGSNQIIQTSELEIRGRTSLSENYLRLVRDNDTPVINISSGGTATTKMQGDDIFNIETDTTTGTLSLGNVNHRHGIRITDEGYSVGIGRVDPVESGVTIGRAEYPVMLNGSGTFIYNNNDIDEANYERLEFRWDDDVAMIEATSSGTGLNRTIAIGNGNGASVAEFDVTGTKVAGIKPKLNSIYDNGKNILRWKTTYTKGFATDVETFTAASDTLDAKNNVCLCDCASNSITINLPTASTASGLQYHVKKTDSSSNMVTIVPDGSETIDGQSSYVVNNQYESITLVCDGSNWFII